MGERESNDDGILSRRRFVSTTAAAGGVAATGQAVAQNDDDSDSGGDAVNVGSGDSIDEAEDVSFDERLRVGELSQLFVEYDTPDHPVIGTDIRFQGVVLNVVETDEARTQVSTALDWTAYEWEGDRILDPIFGPVSWVSDGSVSVPSDFYGGRRLVRIGGAEDADQKFYDKYGSVPYVWGVVDDGGTVDPGTTVEVTGTVAYTGTESSPVEFDGGDGVYLDVQQLSRQGGATTVTAETDSGQEASFTGRQVRSSPRLSTELVTLDYSYDGSYPRPTGGALVRQSGQVESTEFDGEFPDTATMTTDTQDIVVGNTRPGQWDEEDGEGDEGDGDGRFSNTVAVIDESGSMGANDTQSGDQRVDVAKQSVRGLVNFVQSGNQLGIVSFSSGAGTVAALRPVTEDNRESMRNEVDGISSGGGTSITAGLDQALGMLRDANGAKSIILLSDGQAQYPDNVIPELKSLGVSVYTIGIGDADQNLLGRIANETGGQTAFRPDPGDIRSLFQEFAISAQNRSQITSERAMLEEGDEVSGSATVDGSCDEVQFSLTYPGSRITLQPTRPDGSALTEDDADAHRVGDTNEVWTIEDPDTGEWSFTMTGEQLDRPEEATTEVSADSPVGAELFVTDFHYDQTGMYRVELKATNERQRYTGGDVSLTATHESGETEEISLRDDRGGPDPVGNDGIYTGYFHPSEAGEYTFTASISGGDIGDLQRDFTRRLQVDTVVDPIQPYRERSPVSEQEQEQSASLVGQLLEFAPVAAAVAVVALVAAGLKRRFGGGGGGGDGGGGDDDFDRPEQPVGQRNR